MPIITFIDETGKIWTPNGGAQINTSLQQLGTGCGQFASSSDNISTPGHADFGFGTGDWTIDFWVLCAFGGLGGGIQLVSQSVDGANYWKIYYNPGSGGFGYYYTQAGNGTITWPDFFGGISPPSPVWHHLAFVRHGLDALIFFDGGLLSTTNPFSGVPSGIQNLGVPIIINDGWHTYEFMDEFRISKGIARWTAPFSVPVANYSLDSYTKSLIHFDIPVPITTPAPTTTLAPTTTPAPHTSTITKNNYIVVRPPVPNIPHFSINRYEEQKRRMYDVLPNIYKEQL